MSETTGTVISKDGTLFGYRQSGSGPAIILIHGGLMTSRNFTKLAAAMSDTYTVYVPDRRGRGLSGPHGADYSLAKEGEDVEALVNATGAQRIFGLSSGAIVALQSALTIPSITKLALYEPPIPVGIARPDAWAQRYESELAKGNLGAAMASIIIGTADSWSMGMLPGFILRPLMNMAVRADSKSPADAEVPLNVLIPTMHYDVMLVKESEGKMKDFSKIKAEVLLMGGTRSKGYLKAALDALSGTFPNARRILFPRIGHLAADNSGRPQDVARELKQFLINTIPYQV